MVQNVFETDSAEAFTYLNTAAFVEVFAVSFIPIVFIYLVKIELNSFWPSIKSRVGLILTSFVVLLGVVYPQYSDFSAVGRNNHDAINYIIPFKLIDSSYKYIRDNYVYPAMPYKVLDESPELLTNAKQLTILVVGETARAQNFSLNGYKKPTNTFTNKLNLTSFKHVTSCGTATAISVPCMFSRLNHDSYDKRIAANQQNVLDIIQAAGVSVTWLDNNSSCKGVCARITSIKVDPTQESDLCDGEYCFDEIMINYLDSIIAQMQSDNKLIVLHMIGSHGPTYFRRYPASHAVFLPHCNRSDIQNCTQEELLNTYDNTIRYTDYVLSLLINRLKKISNQNGTNTQLLYVSDHGESLGENGVYLHGFPYTLAPEDQTHIPMIYWNSQRLEQPEQTCIKALDNKPVSHDELFDSLLGLMKVKSSTYQQNHDIFLPCTRRTQLVAR
ncbi:phosphoethanolamine--lipid A transferase [Psychrosphaera aestuarii]